MAWDAITKLYSLKAFGLVWCRNGKWWKQNTFFIIKDQHFIIMDWGKTLFIAHTSSRDKIKGEQDSIMLTSIIKIIKTEGPKYWSTLPQLTLRSPFPLFMTQIFISVEQKLTEKYHLNDTATIQLGYDIVPKLFMAL